jgi:hypothetical protein
VDKLSLWNYDGNPDNPGWYPTLHCWDSDEGVFPNAHMWDGERWKGDNPIVVIAFINIVCSDEESAIDLAYENDPE